MFRSENLGLQISDLGLTKIQSSRYRREALLKREIGRRIQAMQAEVLRPVNGYERFAQLLLPGIGIGHYMGDVALSGAVQWACAALAPTPKASKQASPRGSALWSESRPGNAALQRRYIQGPNGRQTDRRPRATDDNLVNRLRSSPRPVKLSDSVARPRSRAEMPDDKWEMSVWKHQPTFNHPHLQRTDWELLPCLYRNERTVAARNREDLFGHR